MTDAWLPPVSLILTIVKVFPSRLPMIQTLPPRSSFNVAGLPLINVPLLGEYWDASLSAAISNFMGGFSPGLDKSSSSSWGTSPVKQASLKVLALLHAFALFLFFRFAMMDALLAPVNLILTIV
eukprot:CAMPEP_0172816352 /NCGR_PEP_ID=MMETSP1075-20121228/12404_1 /TAXON_ID=2916 /ORGANISM="Ceratium fusus, Strain PA161109" /LENGTH=123 /DNA_ID=CAMNT_0013656327 /DNA_START=183 /DNA_END=551 /DNA_ORIENTATION=+